MIESPPLAVGLGADLAAPVLGIAHALQVGVGDVGRLEVGDVVLAALDGVGVADLVEALDVARRKAILVVVAVGPLAVEVVFRFPRWRRGSRARCPLRCPRRRRRPRRTRRRRAPGASSSSRSPSARSRRARRAGPRRCEARRRPRRSWFRPAPRAVLRFGVVESVVRVGHRRLHPRAAPDAAQLSGDQPEARSAFRGEGAERVGHLGHRGRPFAEGRRQEDAGLRIPGIGGGPKARPGARRGDQEFGTPQAAAMFRVALEKPTIRSMAQQSAATSSRSCFRSMPGGDQISTPKSRLAIASSSAPVAVLQVDEADALLGQHRRPGLEGRE